MNTLLEYLSRVFSQWKFWVVVPAWDIGMRIRFGKSIKALRAGIHFRIPILDDVTLVNTRQRVTSTPCVTLRGTRPGYALVKSASIGYRIVDPVRAVMRYSAMDSTIICLTQSELALHSDVTHIEVRLREEMGANGVAIDFVRLVEDVEVRTIRMLNDTWRPSSSGLDGVPAVAGAPVIARF